MQEIMQKAIERYDKYMEEKEKDDIYLNSILSFFTYHYDFGGE